VQKQNKEKNMNTIVPPFVTIIILLTGIFTPLLVWAAWHLVSRQILPKETHQRASAGVGLLLLVWLLLTGSLAIAGVFGQVLIPPVPILPLALLFPFLIVAIIWRYSATFRQVVDAIPQQWLIGIQFLRIIGFVFLVLHASQLLPAAFAIPAGRGDVLTGVLAPLVVYLYLSRKSWAKWAVLGWNLFGMGDLILALTLGFLTNPGPLQRLALDFQFTEARMVTYPLVMIPAFLVPLFLLLHVFSLRTLKREWWSQPSKQEHEMKLVSNA